MEIRGIGLIRRSVLDGMGAVMMERDHQPLHASRALGISKTLTVSAWLTILSPRLWHKSSENYDATCQTGRNVAIIMEVAAMNFRLKSMGHNPADALDQKMLELLG